MCCHCLFQRSQLFMVRTGSRLGRFFAQPPRPVRALHGGPQLSHRRLSHFGTQTHRGNVTRSPVPI
ncbi:ORF156 [Xestia c-nigrum granulovirus]|uniref:ORF156 n=1 Tax=Xestia c-nigrum granulosis virus TaxID=51677 RepID=Q9PYP0_GVXN|nr:ORF156 [Xestia c-nigrum granulovirus]AAF05270.1 ORF156 [Xestia c-nigrum granulovirus]